MTDAGWAEKVVAKRLSDGWSGDAWAMGPGEAADMLLKEHARSVRIMKAEMKRTELDQYYYDDKQKMAVLHALERVMIALQRGRGGKG